MGVYTDQLEQAQYEISPDDDNYIEKLEQIACSFRPFGEAMSAFMAERGYWTDNANIDDRVMFIKARFEKESIPVPRNMKKWFTENGSIDRKTAFKICFAFGFDLDRTQDFFRRVCLQRGIDCHDRAEAAYYAALRNGWTYKDVQTILSNLPETAETGSEVVFTAGIIEELDKVDTREGLQAFLSENAQKFNYNNVTASHYITGLWKKIAAPGGLAEKERELLGTETHSEKQRSVWDVYLQILGLGREELAPVGERSLKHILQNDRLLHPLAQECFPDRQGIQLIIGGKHVSYERVRKLMILLVFYSFWVELTVRRADPTYRALGGDADACYKEISRYLLDTGYPLLYAGNPYDWLFLFAMQDEYPLETFRSFLGELNALRSEEAL